MNREAQALVCGLMGGLLVAITLTGRYTAYVRPGFAPMLLISGGLLLVVALISLVSAIRADLRPGVTEADHAKGHGPLAAADAAVGDAVSGDAVSGDAVSGDAVSGDAVAAHAMARAVGADRTADDDGAHAGHRHSARAPWLLMAPILVLLFAAPPALGSDAVDRSVICGDGQAYPSRRSSAAPPLPPGSPVELTMAEFLNRSLYDAAYSTATTDIKLTAFVARSSCDGNGYSLARLGIACCAADAFVQRVHVDGLPTLPLNTWVTAIVRAVKDSGDEGTNYVPTVTVISLTPIDQPADPYEI